MRINQSNPVNFKSIYIGDSLMKSALNKKEISTNANEVKEMLKLLQKNNIHKKENVDVILHRNENGFYGVISSKTQGTPMHPLYRHSVSHEPEALEKFNNWVDMWDNLYSKQNLK